MIENALIIFAKNPIKGKVKTRLSNALGNEKALEIYTKLLSLTYKHTRNLNHDKYLYLTEFIDNNLYDNAYTKKLQLGSDLGLRMLNAFNELFDKGHKKIVIIGTDCPSLTEKLIDKSFDELNRVDVVLGPANDGGYYLIGLKNPLDYLFVNMVWGNEKVLQNTIKRIIENQSTYFLLKELVDIDDEKDLKFMGY
jgi:rSAM/selenodomain-associated transferase 1